MKSTVLSKYQDTLIIILLAFLYFFSGKLSIDLLYNNKIITLGMFAAEGIALGFALYFGKKVWIGIFIGQFFLALSNNMTLYTSLTVSAINSIEAIIAVIIFNKYKLSKELKTFRDIIGLSFMILFILQPFSAFTANTFLLFCKELQIENFVNSTFSWWFGNVMGQLLFTPFILLLLNNFKKIDFIEFFLYIITFTIFMYILQIVWAISNPFLLFCLTLPVIVFVVSYKGMIYGFLMCVIIAFVASFSLYIKVGTFSTASTIENTLNYNFFILVYVVIVFIIGVLFEERKDYEKKLKYRIKEAIKKNRKQELLLVQQNRFAQRGEMIAMIAHQWRQPLSSISSTISAIELKTQLGNLDEKFIIENTKKIHNYTKYLSDTIDDFRNFFKQDKTKQKILVNDIVKNALKIIEDELKSRHIEIILNLNSSTKLETYKNELQQALLNIIKNAEDALVENEIKNPIIQIESEEDHDFIYLHVKDNAGGINKDIQDKIFEPYFSTKGKNGTGLGLYMSKIIIEKHCNGKLSFKDIENGTLFTMQFKKTKK